MVDFYNDAYANLPRWIFQQDNAPCHNARRTKEWLYQMNVRLMNWPARSPDLNPIENIWAILKTIIARENPASLDDLARVISHAWISDLTQDTIRNCINSMTSRMETMLDSGGEISRW